MRGRFARRVVAVLLVLAVVPLAAAALLLDRVIDASRAVADGEHERSREAIERARSAYTALFAERKAQLKRRGHDLALAAPTGSEALRGFLERALADDETLRKVGVFSLDSSPSGYQLANSRPIADTEFRELRVDEQVPGGRLEITFVTPRAPFREFEALREIESGQTGLSILHGRLGTLFRRLFLAGLGLVVAAATLVGLLLARRVTRRVTELSLATRRLAAGDLDARVAPSGSDEIAELGRAFNELVAEQKSSRERIAWLQKVSAWQDVARRLAHEIKNPLTPIQLAVQQLKTSYVPVADGDRYAATLAEASAIVAEEIAGLRRLVEEFSAFAKLPEVALAPTDAMSLVDDLLRGHAYFEGRVELKPIVPSPTIRADRWLLRRALTNLIENALEAGAKRVWISIETRVGEAALIVADDGPGIPAALGERAFDPYVTTKDHGTGLGLAIVKKIVLEHGGAIRLDARDGGGARFTLTLPLGA